MQQYTYYTITAFNIRVPTAIKRTLTTLQITQFLIGASYAMIHSFVYYTIPVQVPVTKPAAPASSMAAVPTDSVSIGGLLDGVKQLIFGAAEAANAAAVVSPKESYAQPSATDAIEYETQYKAVPCVTTSGATFAIWLNVLYLAPLTYLFVSFFIASYMKRNNSEAQRTRAKSGGPDRRLSNAMIAAEKAGWDAAKATSEEVYGQGNDSAVAEEELEPITANGRNPRTLRSRTNGVEANGKKH
jgi:hypothetical protein